MMNIHTLLFEEQTYFQKDLILTKKLLRYFQGLIQLHQYRIFVNIINFELRSLILFSYFTN